MDARILMIQDYPSHTPQLVVRVGITGHRLGRLPGELSIRHLIETIGKALKLIQKEARDLYRSHSGLYQDGSPLFRLIFAPAGGLEYLAAGEAIDLCFDLQMILPFDRKDYQINFLSEAWLAPLNAAFEEVVQKSQEIVELDGSPRDSESALEAVRESLLRQCDVLVAVWDGEHGYIGQVVREALARDLPVLRIDPRNVGQIVLCERGLKPGDPLKISNISKLADRLETVFILSLRTDPGHKRLRRFLARKHLKGFGLFRRFRDLTAHEWKNHPDPPAGSPRTPWASLPSPNNTVEAKILHRFRPHFKRADNLANSYGDLYRSFFLMTYGLGAFAVLSAFYGIYFRAHAAFWIELTLISVIIVLVVIARYSHLHERWIDYRLLGEGLRQMAFLAPLARVTPAFEVPAHLDHDDPGRTWFNWYFRAVVREAGLISTRMDRRFLEKYRDILADAVDEQVKYHAKNAHKMHLVHQRLRGVVVWLLFPVTLLACVTHLISETWIEPLIGPHEHERLDFFLSLFAIAFPAVGAALEGISHQGELDRIERRSQALGARLKALHTRLTETEKPITSKDLGTLAEYFCQIQVLEQADWRAAFVSKPISPA